MQSYAAKIVLLLAVVTSQIVGGSSCCCRSRFLASSMDSVLRPAVSSNIHAEEYSCPTCCRQRVDIGRPDATASDSKLSQRITSFSSGDKCTCVRHLIVCTPEEEPKDNSVQQRQLLQHKSRVALDEFGWLLTIQNKAKCSYSPPFCHWPVNRLWQCLACIWIV